MIISDFLLFPSTGVIAREKLLSDNFMGMKTQPNNYSSSTRKLSPFQTTRLLKEPAMKFDENPGLKTMYLLHQYNESLKHVKF